MTDDEAAGSGDVGPPPRERRAMMVLHLEINGKDASDVVLDVTVDPSVTSFSDRQELVLAGLAAITNQLGKIWNT